MFIHAVQANKQQYQDRFNDWYQFYISRITYSMIQIHTFMRKLNRMRINLKNKKYHGFNDIQIQLMQCRDLKDFNEYTSYAKNYMKSKKIQNCESSIQDFDFGF